MASGKYKRSTTGDFRGLRGGFDIDLSVDNKEFVEMLERLKYEGLVKTKDIRRVFAKVAKPVKMSVQRAARSSFRSDPRKSWKGVRVITLKKGKGVVVGLLDPKKAGKASSYEKQKGGKSGIVRQRERSRRTNQVDNYQGADRSFILRMLNQGTVTRIAGTRGSVSLKTTANRGSLTAKRFFNVADGGMKQASQSLAVELGKIIEQRAKGS